MTLPDYITAHLGKPFAWGSNDCVTFSFGWANIAAGRDVLSIEPSWRSKAQAYQVIESLGGLKAAIDKRMKPIDPRMARDGDLALYRNTVCLFSGSDIVSVGLRGLEFVPRKAAECAWSY